MSDDAYRPPKAHEGPSPARPVKGVLGARILFVSFLTSHALPQIIGFFAGIYNAAWARSSHASPQASLASIRGILAVNALTRPAALTALPIGVWILTRSPRQGPTHLPSTWRFGVLLSATVCSVLAWVYGVRRFLQGTTPVRSHALDLAIELSTILAVVAIVLLIRRFAGLLGDGVMRMLSNVTLIAIALVLALSITLEDPEVSTLIPVIILRAARWILVFVVLWRAQPIERAIKSGAGNAAQAGEH